MKKKIKIAIQKSGRLNSASMDFLNSLGLEFAQSGTSLTQECTNFDLSLLLLRDDDIPEFVSRDVADFGIVGKNVLAEKAAQVDTVMPLVFGVCRLVIAAPGSSAIKKVEDLEGERIATSYPHVLRTFLKKNGINAAIIPISGSVEIAPELNLADAICDIVQSGTTLKAHNLVPVATVLESQAVLVESPFQKENKAKFFELIKRRV